VAAAEARAEAAAAEAAAAAAAASDAAGALQRAYKGAREAEKALSPTARAAAAPRLAEVK